MRKFALEPIPSHRNARVYVDRLLHKPSIPAVESPYGTSAPKSARTQAGVDLLFHEKVKKPKAAPKVSGPTPGSAQAYAEQLFRKAQKPKFVPVTRVSKAGKAARRVLAAIGKAGGKAAVYGGGVGLGVGAIAGASHLYSKFVEPVAFKKDFQKAIDFEPSLKDHDPTKVEARFRTLRNFNRNMSEDPLVASSFIKQTLEFPIVTPAVLKDVTKAQRPEKGVQTRDVAKAVSMLMGGGGLD